MVLLAAALVAALAATGRAELATWAAGAFLFAWLTTPALGAWIAAHGPLDRPGGRNGLAYAVPRMGGLVLLPAFAVACVVLALDGAPRLFGLLGGGVLLASAGAWDDTYHLTPRWKIVWQLSAAGVLYAAGYRLPELGLPGIGVLPLGVFQIAILVFWVVLVTNALNLIDGIDGQASGVMVIALGGCVALGHHSVLAVAVAASLLGFLAYNLPPARIYLGDTGSLFLGFLLAALLLDLPTATNVPVMLGLAAYPIGDTVLSMLRRFVRAKPIFWADQSHIHHKIRYHLGDSTPAALACVFAMAAVAVAAAVWRPHVVLVVGLLLAWCVLGLILVYAGRVGIGLMWSARKPFRDLHMVRFYLLQRMEQCHTSDEVLGNLERLVRDAPLCEINCGPVRILGPGHEDPRRIEERLALPAGDVRWSYMADGPEQAAYTAERKTVVCDVLRRADQRLRLLAHNRTGRNGANRESPEPNQGD